MSRFPNESSSATDKQLERKHNDLVELLNRYAITKHDILAGNIYKAAAQTFSTGTSATKIAFDTNVGDLSISSNGILIPTGSWVASISLQAEFASNTTGVRYFEIQQDTTVIAKQKMNAATTGASMQQLSVSLPVSGGQVIYGYLYQNSGGNLDMTGGATGATLRIVLIPVL